MVATWNPAAASTYYTRRRETEYYAGGNEPDGCWYAPAGDFGVADGSRVERQTFEQLYDAIGEDGRALLDQHRRHKARTSAFDVTLSAPRSVALAWAFASYDTKLRIEVAQLNAVRATLAVLEREAAWARRGRNGAYIEHVPVTAALYQHGESRPAEHIDGRVFADPNLHTHAVILNLATRADGTVGALHSKLIRDFKMAAGATYHAELAYELQAIGFAIDRIGKNGTFEIAGVDDNTIRYFSARRQTIEAELADHGVVSHEATALAAAITKATRSAKRRDQTLRREDIWVEAANSINLDVDTFTERLRQTDRPYDRDASERLLSERLATLPAALTEYESVVSRRELLRSVTAALVGTGLPAWRADAELGRLLQKGIFLAIGQDPLGLPCYSTIEMLTIEREVVATAQKLASMQWRQADPNCASIRNAGARLSAEQVEAITAATSRTAIAIIEGAPGSGKTTTLTPIVTAYHERGCRVIATATAWRIANMLRDDLGIDARATASWIAALKSGQQILDERTVLIVDEAGLLSSRDMHTLLGAVALAGAKVVLVGDRRQLQAIGAGPGLDLVTRAVAATRIDKVVRQRETWAREAITEFGRGRAAAALKTFADHGLLIEAEGAQAAISAAIDVADRHNAEDPNAPALILAKSNTAVAAISRAVRERRKAAGRVCGREVCFTASTSSGHATEIRLARGDKIRFLARNDQINVINGTVATVTKVTERQSAAAAGPHIRIEADIAGRRIIFDPMTLADPQGRPRLGWAYASTIHGAQGLTVDNAVIYLDPNCNRHDVYVAASRARERTTLVVDVKGIDRRLTAELPFDRQNDDLAFSREQRRAWLGERLSRASPKVSTLDVIETSRSFQLQSNCARDRRRELSHEL